MMLQMRVIINASPDDRVRPDNYQGYSGGASSVSERRWEQWWM